MDQFTYITRQLERINGDVHLLSMREAAKMLGVRRGKDGALQQAINRGEIKTIKIGARIKIRRGELLAWLERKSQ